MKLKAIDPFTLAILIWLTIHGGFAVKAGADKVVEVHHQYILSKPHHISVVGLGSFSEGESQ